LRQLAAISIAVSAGLLDPAPSLARIPEELLADAVDQVDEVVTKDDRRNLLLLLAQDPRDSVRVRVAAAAGGLAADFPNDAHELVRRLARDRSPAVRAAAAVGLCAVLEGVSAIQRLEMGCQWAVSEHLSERTAMANALGLRANVPLADLIMEQLAGDEEREVRTAAAQALVQRCYEAPVAYRALAQRLTADPERRVRRAARRVLEALG
jgi:HEAT repeat protein